jgi:predicted nucleotidyltransferase
MKDEVISKLKEIADEFILNLQEAEIEADIDDIILIGSNANYNYTKNSDLDIHIILNNKDLEPKIAESLYGAYRSIFNKNYDISIYNIPVEIYVELPGSDRISNGVYSIKNEK